MSQKSASGAAHRHDADGLHWLLLYAQRVCDFAGRANVWFEDPPLSSGLFRVLGHVGTAPSLQGASRHFTYDWTFTPGVLMEPGSLVMVILAPW